MEIIQKCKPLAGGIDLNYEVVGGTTAPTTFKKENTIWINTSNALKEHYFCYNQPTDYVTTTTYYVFGGSTASSDYKGGWTNGNASSTSNSQITCGTDGWIRTTSKVDLTNISMLTAYIRINQPYESEIYLAVGDSYGYRYTGSKHTRLDVASGSATSNIYKTITLDVSSLTGSHYICLSHRGYGSSYWQYIKGTMTTDNTPSGTVWIQTDSDTATVGFNALKRNELMVYPTKLKQWNGSAWKSVNGSLYQGNTATRVYSAGYSLIDNFSSYTVTAWDLTTVLGRPSDTFGLAKSGNNLIYTCGAGKQNVNLIPTFDLSKYSALVITVSAQTLNTSKGVRIGFVTWENRGADWFSAAAEIFKPGTYRVDLSNLTSSLYFSIRPINDTGYTGTLTISELILEE